MKYPSKKDWWLGLILFGAIVYGAYISTYALLSEKADLLGIMITIIINLSLISFISWLWFTTYYVLEEKELIIRCGPINKRIPYREISSAHKTLNPISSPALSLKRINITYQFGMALISPKNRDEFLQELSKRCPNATIKFNQELI
ncbi:PH domain-containing protein [Fictibacillus sp. 5RED26]|uniref:PH domain-containing protein n=1 Tax=Fictibacillus sp. 5RED26 TaxID=2745876 RepID=UPI0018CCBCA8|nr:PH domain-containing protein [Fictibacillus sp. 5RED26]MBH0155419.1 PH domain-containing protein [Fictibacillus sp. 5RED26]